MPRKALNGPTATVAEVVDLWKLGNLANKWARAIGTGAFPQDDLDAYRDLCAAFAVDGTLLLYIFQKLRDAEYGGEEPSGNAVEKTGVIEIPDVRQSS